MANPSHLEILRKGVSAWNRWREEQPEERPDLVRAELGGSGLRGANFERAQLYGACLSKADLGEGNLIGANLQKADLSWADLGGANLSGANLRWARLQLARLTRANLSSADLTGSNLTEANLRHADLSGANLSQAFLAGTLLAAVNLRSVEGLTEVQHLGPSFIAAPTLQLSSGQIPDLFLRGCGFDDWEIVVAKLRNPNLSTSEITNLAYEAISLRDARPMMVNNLFISYSHDDDAFVNLLSERLDGVGVRYWRDIHDLTAGRLETQIDRAIRLHPVVLLILSKNSVNKPWVEWEAKTAQSLERELREKGTPQDILLPIALDDAWKTCHWPGWLRHQIEQYNVLSFEGWEDPAVVHRQFQRILAGLPLYGPKGVVVEG